MEVIRLDADGQNAVVSLHGNELTVNTGLIETKIGDYVLIHAGCALEVLAKGSALEILELFEDIEALARS
jgi:hydrogenase expression/formation protein HypC